jgi:hypothetical protein
MERLIFFPLNSTFFFSLWTPRSFRWFSQINSHPAVFFSHNKPANSTFSHNNPAKRTGWKLNWFM